MNTLTKQDTRSDARKALDARNEGLAELARPRVVVRQRVPMTDEDLAKAGVAAKPGARMVRNTTVRNPQKQAAKAAAAARKATRKQRILDRIAAQ